MENKIKTGIRGFDSLVEGGLNRGKVILLCGTPGTGKTIFALEYLYRGATKFDQKGLYITFEERREGLIGQANKFGWDLEKLEKEHKIKIITIPTKSIKDKTVEDIVRTAKRDKYDRVVIDSLSTLAINTPSTFAKVTDLTDVAIKRFIYRFINELKTLENATTLLISQTVDGQISSDGVSEFITDGIIYIMYEAIAGQYSRSLMIRKMRETNNDADIHPMEISDKGVILHPGLGGMK